MLLRGPSRPDLLREEYLPDILTATAARRPEHPALIWGDRVITYSELSAASHLVAHALSRRGATAQRIIGLLLPRGADLLIAQAGISKSGAAWLPFDADTPPERVRTCLQSSNACGLVTCADWLPRFAGLSVPVWSAEELLADPGPDGAPLPAVRPTDPAYVIYTSGSTGAPKGIVISHRSICHFLRSENELLGVREDDRVYQGFSLAFDMSFEEIWISYLVGATLWIAPPELVSDPIQLPRALTRHRITALHAVPTLMSLIDDPLPTVRLINLGGEACPDPLVERLARPGRRLFNTYGPTETAVSASLAQLRPGEPVTIGLPLPNYGMMVVDENRRPLAAGETGELCIFGPGLAIGYLGRPDLTSDRFVPNPLGEGPDEARLYLTGDLARIDPGGPVHCLGRADDQVKIRGFRVELGEIEAALADQPGVATAAAVVAPISAGIDQLVGFVVSAPDRELDIAALRRALGARLPPYMVPTQIKVLPELPRLSSGKVDRKRLASLPLDSVNRGEGGKSPRDEHEAALYAALGKLFPGLALHPEADFYDDLGGHSLLTAHLVSILRADSRYADLGINDVYRERRLEKIASAMSNLRGYTRQEAPRPRARVPWQRRVCCGLGQAAVIPALVVLHITNWLAPFFTYHHFTGDPGDSILRATLLSVAIFVLALLSNFGVVIAGKWLLLGRLKPGRFSLWGTAYFRWWLSNQLSNLPLVRLLSGTPLMCWYLRAMGARIGEDVFIGSLSLGAADLLTIERGASLGTSVCIDNASVAGGELILGAVHLGRDSVVDSYAVLENDTAVGIGARLGGLSALSAGRRVPDGEIWEGAPARPVQRTLEALPPRPRVSRAVQVAQGVFFAAAGLAVEIVLFMPVFPCFMLIDWMDVHLWNLYENGVSPLFAFGAFFLLAIPASLLLVLATVLVVSGLRCLLPRQTDGIWPLRSLAYCRKWIMSQVLESSLETLHGIYATIFAPTWLRLVGVSVGRGAEVSTAMGIVPDLLTLGEHSFIADGVMLGDEEQRGGWMILHRTTIGRRSFVGNSAYVPNGAIVPDDVLIGVQTHTPEDRQMKPGQTWLGSPPLLLPARERLTGFNDSLTFHPSSLRRLGRAAVEALRVVLPLAFVIATGYLIVQVVMPLAEREAWMAVFGALALSGCLFGLASFLLVVVLKWVLVGRYRPRAAPMWTPFVWISEAVTNLYESLAVPSLLDFLRGTPMLPWALRLLGARMGKGIYLNTTDFTEFDCVRIGDEAELNAWCGPQTHLFEDRIMKIGLVDIGAGVTMGAHTTVLYDTQVGDRVQLGPLTLVAKGERLPADTRWEGSPAGAIH
jgi:non-ribosomal peptide synthetase-like protein